MANCVDPKAVIQLSGPLLLGYQFNWALYGVLCVQVYIYQQAGFTDNLGTKLLVYGLFLLETVQTVLLTHDSFNQFALNYGSYEALLNIYYLWLSLPIFIGISSATIQCYYAWRIYVLGRSRVLAITIVFIALMQSGGAIAEGIISDDLRAVAHEEAYTFKTTTIWLAGTAACDVMIASSMVYFLWHSRTGYKKTNTILNRLIRLVVETGMVTAIVAVLELALFLHFNNTFYHIVLALMLSKIYSNSLLVLLNNRLTARRGHMVSTVSNTLDTRYIADTNDSGPIQVNINQDTYADSVAMVHLTQTKGSNVSQLEEIVQGSTADMKC